MAQSTWNAARLSAEQVGYLAAGPGRAAETALARLMDADLVRVSRQAQVTAVHQSGYGATTPVESKILSRAHGAGRSIDAVVQSAAMCAEMQTLRQHLINQKLMRAGTKGGFRAFRPYLFLIAFITFVIGFSDPTFFVVAVVAFLLALFARKRGILTSKGKAALRSESASDRVYAVALYGLRGAVGTQRVADLFGMSASIVGMLPRKRKKRASNTGSSCGGYTSSCSSCGSGCGSASSCSSSSSSSCSSSSSSSCSSGSSCGGGGGGGD